MCTIKCNWSANRSGHFFEKPVPGHLRQLTGLRNGKQSYCAYSWSGSCRRSSPRRGGDIVDPNLGTEGNWSYYPKTLTPVPPWTSANTKTK